MDGQWTWWRPNGIKDREGNYKSGVKHGLWVSWNDNDHKKGEETYVNGVLDGLVTVWHDNGNKDREGIIRETSQRVVGHIIILTVKKTLDLTTGLA